MEVPINTKLIVPESVKKSVRNRVRNKDFKNFLYLSPAMPFSYHGISNFVYTATRGIGKSVISVETAIILKRK